ncbi:hypothetical protein D3C87_1315540 [compost metagenome]
MGQCAHFIGHHGKAAPVLAGAGGFDGRVERQQVGLFGDAADHVQYLADFPDVPGQFGHRLGRPGDLLNHGADALERMVDLSTSIDRVFGRGFRGIGGRDRVTCHFLDHRGHLIDRGGRLLDFVILPCQATGAFLGDRVQLFGGRG